jgi:hypothetical protein
MDNFELLKKELAIYGIRLTGDDTCTCRDPQSNTLKKYEIDKKIAIFKKEIKSNMDLFFDVCKHICYLLNSPCPKREKPEDIRLKKLFVHSIKSLLSLTELAISNSNLCKKNMQVTVSSIKSALTKTIYDFSTEAISDIPNCFFALEWIFRRCSTISYLSHLLLLSKDPKNLPQNINVKLARGVSGPWSNLDMPMQERVFEWKEIAGEVSGRDKDLRKQRRYRMGFENYNNDKIGEGFFWREIKNEPFSWCDRATEDPYPHRSTLTNY